MTLERIDECLVRSKKVLREYDVGDRAREHGARGADPGGTGEGQGPPGRAAERAEGRAADVRRRLHAPGNTQRPRRVRDPEVTLGRRRSVPAESWLSAFLPWRWRARFPRAATAPGRRRLRPHGAVRRRASSRSLPT